MDRRGTGVQYGDEFPCTVLMGKAGGFRFCSGLRDCLGFHACCVGGDACCV